MKRTIIISFILTALISICGKAQVSDISEVDKQLCERPWLDQSEHDIYGYRITQVFGERSAIQRHSNLGSITSMAYLSQQQLLNGIDTLPATDEKKNELREKYKNEAQGGAIQLYITRASESRANFKWFFVVARGSDDQEKIMEIDLNYQASQLPEANGWWNYTTVLLPKEVAFPFYVYVNDRQSEYLSDFKFMVSK
jgi:hypothetical protein